MNGKIYKATNKKNRKSYIGQSWDYEKRYNDHIKANSGCKAFNNAMKKYGPENFEWTILYENVKTQDKLNNLEYKSIIKYKSMIYQNGYNLIPGGGQPLPSSLKHYPFEKLIEELKDWVKKSWKRNLNIPKHFISHLPEDPTWSKTSARLCKFIKKCKKKKEYLTDEQIKELDSISCWYWYTFRYCIFETKWELDFHKKNKNLSVISFCGLEGYKNEKYDKIGNWFPKQTNFVG